MLYTFFHPSAEATRALQELEEARRELDPYASLPEEYTVRLRRHILAESIHYSTRIEGNTLTLEQVETLLAGERPAAPADQVREVENYREALAYIQAFAKRPGQPITEETIRTLHYLVSKDLRGDYSPGRYRQGQNFVVDRISQRRLFMPPPPEQVPALMKEFEAWLNHSGDLPPAVRAAIAHLNLVAIHPFLDGNGRTARVLDSLVMYQQGFRAQDLVSLEAYFGRDTSGYYRALEAALGPYYGLHRDVTAWVEYHLQAHVQQARASVAVLKEIVAQFDALKMAFAGEELSLWQVLVLWFMFQVGTITNREYRSLTKRSHQSAASDFTALLDRALIVRVGAGRSTTYRASERAGAMFAEIRDRAQSGLTG